MKKVCIFTYSFMHKHHTMVNFHIENLFDGNSCVCVENETDYQTVQRPILVRNEIKLGIKDRLLGPLKKMSNKARKLPAKSIFGTERKEILEFLRREKVDVILCEFGCVGVDITEAISDYGIPIYTYYRGYDATMRIRSRRQQNLIRKTLPKMAGVFFVSGFLKDNLSALGLEHPNSYVVPSGVNTQKFCPAEKSERSFVAVGRLIEKKRPDLTVRAFCQEAKFFPEAVLNVLGGGPMLDMCGKIVHEAGMENQVKLHGEQHHDVVLKYVREAEFFLQHSVTSPSGDAEGAPTSIQEAMACGCVVIATRHAGIPDLIEEGKTGYLIDELAMEDYRKHIKSALSGEINSDKIAQAARDHAVTNLDNRMLIEHVESILTATDTKNGN
ncbi:glycosyltransferase [Roseibium porphyridii]|uniref:Glycosyltransferase n=1 Tax=Roseibium porphyridii TaxID=2866279 RepID=A0ABY8F3D2_9HYPH|nr:glycosyltransferase [Roseibium sp. KMA01]WFE89924.1 glycosyltransferase [Roseibium sp. KMA01]